MRRALVVVAFLVAPLMAWPVAQQSTFRGAVDLIAVDVQVVDREGRPVTGLGADKFEVTIDGRRRRVVSADLVDFSHATSVVPSPSLAAVATTPAPAAATPRPRIIIIAVDCLSFDVAVSRGVMTATRAFVNRLPATDQVGLFAYPLGPKIDPTTDRDVLVRALDSIVGQREGGALSEFHLRPSEVVDIAAVQQGGSSIGVDDVEKIYTRECGPPADRDLSCVMRLTTEARSTALYYEGQSNVSLGTLRSLVKELGTVPERKTLVLVSGGMPASDRPGGRPDIGEMGIQVGKEAARANTTIYTLYVDASYAEPNTAEARKGLRDTANLARDSAMLGRWLEQFSGAAGGALFKVLMGNGELAFDRILTEMSAYYLLGVEPVESDRDGHPHQIKVKANQKSVTVRSRTWVVVPTRSALAAAAAAANTPVAPTPAVKAPVAPARPLSAAAQAIADAFDRGDDTAVRDAFAKNGLANVIRDVRLSDSPWPTAPRRAAVFALELAVAGLRSDNGFANDEGGKLLAEYNTRVRQPLAGEAFECAWHWTEVAALEGLMQPENAMLFVTHALERCPAEPRLALARAVVTEQRWLLGAATGPGDVREITQLYEEAMKFPETSEEARVRAASFCLRAGQLNRAVELIGGTHGQSPDQQVRFLRDLIRGQILRVRGEGEAAAAAFRAALATWPGAQSARVALMTLLISRGDPQEAGALADAIEQGRDDQFDPWWLYWQGDARMYLTVVGRLRDLVR